MIIVPVVAMNMPDALAQVKAANKVCDAIELRLDYFQKLGEHELSRLMAACKKPCICTCRSAKEGGRFEGPDNVRVQVLKSAIKNGAHYVDIEFETKPSLRKSLYKYAKVRRAKVILSKHCTTHTPPLKELRALLERMRKDNAHVVKIVAKANKHDDNKVILALFKDASRKRVRLIAFCMGDLGKDSRILSRFIGGFATFASLGKGLESAQGQISVQEMRKMHTELGAVL